MNDSDLGVIELVSDDTANLVLKILTYGITPSISILGITGNVLSIMILTRQGLQKCSNILLISLAFADLCYLVGFNNIPKILYDTQGRGRFLYSEKVSHFLYVFYFVFFLLDYGMGYLTLTIPMLITVERLVAVFMPLKFSFIITPTRTWIVLIIIAIYSLSYMTYSCFWYEFKYEFDVELNRTVGIMARSERFFRDQHAIGALEEIYFSIKVQPIFTLVGCVLIIIKVKLASKKRQEMISNSNANNTKKSVSKTTQILLSVCLVYIFVCAVIALPAYIPENYMSYSLTSHEPTNMGIIMYQVINIVMCTNSSWNFIIYIGLNKNFRESFHEIIGRCFCGRRLILAKTH